MTGPLELIGLILIFLIAPILTWALGANDSQPTDSPWDEWAEGGRS